MFLSCRLRSLRALLLPPTDVGVSASIHGGPSFYFSTWHLAPAGVNTRRHPERLRSDLTRPGWIF